MRVRALHIHEIYRFLEARGGAAPLRQVAEAAAALVPPGPAWREGQEKRKADALYRARKAAREAGRDPTDVAVPELRELNKLSVIRTGQKRLALKSINTERQAGRLERYEHEGRQWLRTLNSDF